VSRGRAGNPGARRIVRVLLLVAAAWGVYECLRPRDIDEYEVQVRAWDRWEVPQAPGIPAPRLQGRGATKDKTSLARGTIAALASWWRGLRDKDRRRTLEVEVVGGDEDAPAVGGCVTSGSARFYDLPRGRRASVSVGPLADGRVGWVSDVSTDAGRVEVRLERSRNLTGRSSAPPGWELRSVELAARPWKRAVLAPDGTFTLSEVPRAEVHLRARLSSGGWRRRLASADLLVPADRDEVDWQVVPILPEHDR
jgi:hypothetical protein